MSMKAKILPFVVMLLCLAAIAGLVLWSVKPSMGPNEVLGRAFEYDLAEINPTDPSLIKWKETKAIPISFKTVRALAIGGPRNAIHVAGDNAIAVMNMDGRDQTNINIGAAATCLAVDESGSIYAGVKDHIEVYRADGTKSATWGILSTNSILTSIAVGEKNIFVADAGAHEVVRYDKSGKEQNRLVRKDQQLKISGFVIPSPCFDLAMEDEKNVWVVDPGRHTLVKFRENGDVVSSWGKSASAIEGFCGCCNPSHIALLPDGSFVTSEKGFVRVKVYGPAGDFVSVVAGSESFDPSTTGLDLAVNSKGQILVLDTSRKTVRVFDKIDGAKTAP